MKTDTLRENLIFSHAPDQQYFALAEVDPTNAFFWGDETAFRRMFDKLDLTNVVELACGHGRHAAKIVNRAGHLTLVDPVSGNIDVCRKRLSGHENVSYIVNSGSDLKDIPSESQTALYCYDAMVHFEPMDVISYINEASRILVPGGMALLHYSNNEDNVQSYTDSPSWRNFFTEKMMRAFSWRADLSVIESEIIPWGEETDALTLLKKGD